MKLRRAFLLFIWLAIFATIAGAQPVAPDSLTPPAKASKPGAISPYRLSPAIQSGTAYTPISEGAVYVDPAGDDANHGQSEDRPVRSLVAAYSRLADRRSMLLKRGGVYEGSISKWTYSNKVVEAYGSGPKPIVKTGGRPFLHKFGVATVSNVSLRNIIFDNEGNSGNLFVWIGGGQNILIENCEFLSGGLVIQDFIVGQQTSVIRSVKLLGNRVIGAWADASVSHKSGLFAAGIDGLEIIGNTFDHNGWNPAKKGGHATIYNHNMYLGNVANVVVKNNDILRAASVGVKVRSDTTGGSHDIVIEGNRFVEGEVGITIGGNTNEPARFRNVRIVGNTFDRLGATQPTKRSFFWGIDVVDNVNTVVRDNVFTSLPDFPNHFLVRVSGTQERVVVENNVRKP